jgi:hypothetical protein
MRASGLGLQGHDISPGLGIVVWVPSPDLGDTLVAIEDRHCVHERILDGRVLAVLGKALAQFGLVLIVRLDEVSELGRIIAREMFNEVLMSCRHLRELERHGVCCSDEDELVN